METCVTEFGYSDIFFHELPQDLCNHYYRRDASKLAETRPFTRDIESQMQLMRKYDEQSLKKLGQQILKGENYTSKIVFSVLAMCLRRNFRLRENLLLASRQIYAVLESFLYPELI